MVARLPPQVEPLTEKSGPLTEVPFIVTAVLPVLLRVATWVALVLPTACILNVKEEGETETIPATALTV